MKLTYRGVQYDYNAPMLEVTESDILCQYRGRSIPFRYVRHVPFPQPVAELTYRGAAYRTTRAGSLEPVAQTARTSIFAVLQGHWESINPMLASRRQLLQAAAQAHHDSILRSLEHRIEVARHQGNMTLLQQLEQEMQQLA